MSIRSRLMIFGQPMRDWHKLFAILIVLLTVSGALSAVTRAGKDGWYDTLQKSTLTPPDWVFGVVWPSLYVMMGIALWWVVLAPASAQRTRAIRIFLAQLIINWAWSFVFFTAHWLLLGFLWIIGLVAMVIWTMIAIRPVSRRASIILIPYLGWTMFASYLAGTIWVLNSPG